MFYRFRDAWPVCAASAYVHPQATVIGDVLIGADCYIGPGAVLRGDWGSIVLEDGCNVQESCTLHMFPGQPVLLRRNAHIGHGAVVHGAEIGEDVLVGMNAVIMDEAVIGAGSIVGALTFVKTGMRVPPRSLLVGNPARVVREVSDEQLAWKRAGTALYQTLPAQWQLPGAAAPVEPLRARPADYRPADGSYRPWSGDDKAPPRP